MNGYSDNENVVLRKINFDGQNIFINLSHVIITFEAVILQDGESKLKITIPNNIRVLKPGQSVVVKIEIFKEGKE
jgi:hypothetical protein